MDWSRERTKNKSEKFISGDLYGNMLIFKMKTQNVGFVNIMFSTYTR